MSANYICVNFTWWINQLLTKTKLCKQHENINECMTTLRIRWSEVNCDLGNNWIMLGVVSGIYRVKLVLLFNESNYVKNNIVFFYFKKKIFCLRLKINFISQCHLGRD